MTYTRRGPFINGFPTGPYIDAAFFNQLEDGLTAVSTAIAPAPSGGDDTAVIQALLNTAQASGGTLALQAGTYRVNLATTSGYYQPIIRGQGMGVTFLQGTVNTSPVLRMKGISGASSGGYVADLTIMGTGGVGFEIADANGVHWDRLHFTGTLAEGIRFHNESAGGYAEYNSGSAIFDPGVVLPVRYRVTGGNASFHGSGLTHGSLINQSSSSTTAPIQIDAGAFPYAAPMTVAIFPRQAGGAIIANATANPTPSFFGTLDIEVQVTAAVNVAGIGANQYRVLYEGSVTGLAAQNLRLGNLYLADRVYYVGTNVFPSYKPLHRTTTLAAGTVTVLPDNVGTCTVQIDLVASNYHYAYLLHCWQSPYDPTGVVTVVANPKSLNTAGLGAPTFAWANNGLTVTNAAYSSGVTAYVSVQPLANPVAADVLGQF